VRVELELVAALCLFACRGVVLVHRSQRMECVGVERRLGAKKKVPGPVFVLKTDGYFAMVEREGGGEGSFFFVCASFVLFYHKRFLLFLFADI
jgi:hypothetical protein